MHAEDERVVECLQWHDIIAIREILAWHEEGILAFQGTVDIDRGGPRIRLQRYQPPARSAHSNETGAKGPSVTAGRSVTYDSENEVGKMKEQTPDIVSCPLLFCMSTMRDCVSVLTMARWRTALMLS